MQVVYAPKGAEEQRFDLDPENYDLEEIELVESVTGRFFPMLMQDVASGAVTGLRAVIWVHLRRADPKVQYADVKPKLSEIRLVQSREELQEFRDSVVGRADFPNREQVLAAIDAELGALLPVEPGKDDVVTLSPNRSTRRAASRRSGTSTKKS